MLIVRDQLHNQRGFRPKTHWLGDSAKVCGLCGAVSFSARFQFNQRNGIKGFLLALARRRFHKKKEGNCMPEALDYAMKLAKFPDRVAAIIAKTYAVMGDAAQLSDDEALMMIRDLCDELDDTLVERNKNKRLSRR
jgi:hypothetical protein